MEAVVRMLSDTDVGRRVVVRRRLADTARARFTDVLGLLVAADTTALVVRPDRGGADVTIPRSAVVAAKPVPPRRRRIGVQALARLAAATWPAPDTEELGDWLLRAADGWTGRANSALVVGRPDGTPDQSVDRVVDWYRRRGLRPACQLPSPVAAGTPILRPAGDDPPAAAGTAAATGDRHAPRAASTDADEIDALLAARGWRASPWVLVLAAPIERAGHDPTGAGLPPVTLTDTPSADWLALAAARRGGLPPAAHRVLRGGNPTFAEVRDAEGALLAAGRGAVADQHLCLSSVEVVPAQRRRGLARHVMAALTRSATDRAHTVFLQVEEHNEAALALYARLGFHVHHRYRYRRAAT